MPGTIAMHVDSLFGKADHHPIVVTPAADSKPAALCDYLSSSQGEIIRLLTRHGGILFRGFRLDGPADFQACAESAGAAPFQYVGGDSPRTRVADDVYTST